MLIVIQEHHVTKFAITETAHRVPVKSPSTIQCKERSVLKTPKWEALGVENRSPED